MGFMVEEVFEDPRDDTGTVSFPGWRCVSCGAIFDQTILTNQAERPKPFVDRARKRHSTMLG
jgi:hypothetical protein